jgi:hypothetical protein
VWCVCEAQALSIQKVMGRRRRERAELALTCMPPSCESPLWPCMHGRSPVSAFFYLPWRLSFGGALYAAAVTAVPLQRTPLSPSTVSACCFAALDGPLSRPAVRGHPPSSSSGGGARSAQERSAHHRRRGGVRSSIQCVHAHRVRR